MSEGHLFSSLHMSGLEKFLARLTDGARPAIAAYNVAAIFAHPNEIIACGATLHRLKGAHLVVVTDGVPQGYHARGAVSVSAGTSWHELLAAAELARHRPGAVSGFAVSQGHAAEHLVPIGRRLAHIFAMRGTAIALAPAYEADDPDRDATAFAVRNAAELCRQRGQDIAVIEMPFAAGDEHPADDLVPEDREIIALPLGPQERALKERMRACFTVQSEAWNLAADAEEFRLPPRTNFEELSDGMEVFTSGHEGFLSGALGVPRAGFSAQTKVQA